MMEGGMIIYVPLRMYLIERVQIEYSVVCTGLEGVSDRISSSYSPVCW